MELGSLLILAAMLLAAAAFIAQPLLEGGGERVTSSRRRLSELQAERDQVLSRLEELEMDHEMGKILTSDYQAHRRDLLAQGARVLRSLEALEGSLGAQEEESDLDALIESQVDRLRRARGEFRGQRCPTCGRIVNPADNFCAHCGASLAFEEEG